MRVCGSPATIEDGITGGREGWEGEGREGGREGVFLCST